MAKRKMKKQITIKFKTLSVLGTGFVIGIASHDITTKVYYSAVSFVDSVKEMFV